MTSFLKFTLLIILLNINSYCAFSQKESEIGFMLGATYYQGDLNSSKLFQTPFFAGGILYRYNFSERYALRASLIMGKLISNDANSNYLYQNLRNKSFNSTLFEFTPQMEFNFLEYVPHDANYRYTPYVSLGATVLYETIAGIHLAVPFGFGIKYSLSPKISTGIEWNYRKTFSDKLDNLNDFNPDGKQLSYQHNNDWYSYAGIFIAFRFNTSKPSRCPAYGGGYNR
jgi:hypothetical protein